MVEGGRGGIELLQEAEGDFVQSNIEFAYRESGSLKRYLSRTVL
jgi:hypothetical protein